MSSEAYWKTVGQISDRFSRDQKLRLAKYLAAEVGAVISFPTAREKALTREVASLNQKLVKGSLQQRPKAKPENVAMKGTPEEAELHRAQEALRKKRLELGLAKNDRSDLRLQAEVGQLDKAKAAFAAKKASLKTGVTPQQGQ